MLTVMRGNEKGLYSPRLAGNVLTTMVGVSWAAQKMSETFLRTTSKPLLTLYLVLQIWDFEINVKIYVVYNQS